MTASLTLNQGMLGSASDIGSASRTVPFVAKTTDSAIASIAARLMAG